MGVSVSTSRRPGVARRHIAVSLVSLFVLCCGPQLRPAVSMKIKYDAPADAAVMIDEEYIGPLSYVAAHGVRLPKGEHRITVEKEGYFPFDQLVESDRETIHLNVKMVEIPD
jgi:hypothetical protein